VSSERRDFLPVAFLSSTVVASNKLYTAAGAGHYEMGVLSTTMHMAWLRTVTGRLKSDYQYSAQIVYNNFPWPDPTQVQRLAIEGNAKIVLDLRAQFVGATLAQLYDPITMPPELMMAHQVLDRSVDMAYGRRDFKTEAERVAFLFDLYQKIAAPLDVAPLKVRARGRTKPG
jgi:hypothetical protein